MSRILHRAVLSLFAVTAIFSMYRETPAQPRAARETKPKATLNQYAAPEISYRVSMSKPWTHLLEVEMRLKWAAAPQSVELKMPVWTPGSYLVREYARHLQDFSAKTGTTALAWQ